MAITFDIGFRLKGQSLDEVVKPSLSKLSQEIDSAFQTAAAKGSLSQPINEAITAANALGTALKNAQTDKGLSFSAMEQSLARSGMSVSQMVAKLGSAGPAFQQSFNLALNSIATANRGITILSSKLQEAGRVFTQAFKFTIANQSIRFLQSAIQDSINWVKDLDSTLAQISVVTGKVGTQLDGVYENIVQGAADLRVAASEYAEASVIFYQQGLNDAEVARRTEVTIQAAKAAGQSVETMASQLTAIWNSYNMLSEEQERAAAVGAKLAASNAVNFKDIAEAMQVSAAGASQMGVSYNSLAAIIATVGDVTQQSASIIGNAYKTIFSRFEQLTTTGTDGEVTLNSVSSKLQALGVQIMDSSGKLKDLEEIIYNTGMSWETYSEEQQLAIAQLAGGTRQYGQFLALMQNFPKYLKNLEIASKETGSTLIEQFMAARDSVETAAEMSKEAWSKAFKDLFKADSMKDLYKTSERIANIVSDIVGAFGGLRGIFIELGFLYQRQIADKINDSWIGLKNIVENLTPGMQRNTIDKKNKEETERLQREFAIKKQSYDTGTQKRQEVEFDEAGALRKLELAQRIKREMVDINTVIAKGNEEQKSQANSAKLSFESAQNQYQGAIDKITAMGKGFLELDTQIKAQKESLKDEADVISILTDAESGELIVQQEKLDNLNEQIEKEKELLLLKQSSTNALIEIQNGYKESYNKKNQEISSLESSSDLSQKDSQRLEQLKQEAERLKSIIDMYSIKIKNSEKEISKLTTAFEQTVQEAKKVNTEINRIEENGKKAGEKFTQALDLKGIFSNLGKELSLAFLKTEKDIPKEVQRIFNEVAESLKGTAFEKNGLMKQLLDVSELDPNNPEIFNKITQLLQMIQAKINTFNESEDNDVKIDLGEQSFNILSQKLQEIISGTKQVTLTQTEFATKIGEVTSKININISSFTQMLSSVLSLSNGFDQLFLALNESSLSFTKLLTISLQIIPALSRMATSNTMLAVANRLVTTTTEKGTVVLAGNTFATIANAVAKKLLGKAEVDLAKATTVASASLTLGIGAIIAITAAIINSIKAAQQAKTDLMNTSYETLQASKDISSSFREEAKTFEEAAEKAKKYSEDTEKVNEAYDTMEQAVDNMIKKLKESEDAHDKAKAKELEHIEMIAKLTGKYDDLIAKIKEMNEEFTSKTLSKAKLSYDTAGAAFKSDMEKDKGNIALGTYHAEFTKNAPSEQNKNKDSTIEDIIKKGNYSHIWDDGTIAAKNNLEDLKAAFEEALNLQKELTKQGFGDTKYFQELSKWIEKSSDSYAKMEESAEAIKDAQIDLLTQSPDKFVDTIFNDSANADNEVLKNMDRQELKDILTIPEGGFSNLEQYEEYRQALLDLAEAEVIAEDAVNDFLKTNEKTDALEIARDNINKLQKDIMAIALDNNAKNMGPAKTDEDIKDNWQKRQEAWIKAQGMGKQLADKMSTMSEEELIMMLDFEIDPERLEEINDQIDKHIERKRDLQVVAQIDVEIENIRTQKDITKGLKDGDSISPEDWAKLDATYQSLFKLTEEGTYQLQSSAEELNDAIETLEQQELLNKISITSEKAKYYAKGGDNGSIQDAQLAEQFSQDALEAQQAYLMTADSIIELDSLMKNLHETMGDSSISYNAYAESLINLGYQYDNCSQEIQKYQEALKSGNEKQVVAAEEALKVSVLLGEAANQYGEDVNVLEEQARELAEVYSISAQEAAQIVIRNQKLQQGVDKLAKSFKTWQNDLKKYAKGSKEYAAAVVGITDAVKDLIGVSEDFSLPDGFLEGEEGAKNLKLLGEAAEGSQHAINELGLSIAKANIESIDTGKSITELSTEGGQYEKFNGGEQLLSSYEEAKQGVLNGIDTIQNHLTELENGADLSGIFDSAGQSLSGFAEDLNTLAMEGKWTADQMNDYLSSIGMTADVELTTVDQDMEVPGYQEVVEKTGEKTFDMTSEVTGGSGMLKEMLGQPVKVSTKYPMLRKTSVPTVSTQKGQIQVAQISTDGPAGKPNIHYSGTGGGGGGRSAKKPASSGGGGSSSSNAKKTASVKPQRYTDNKNAISDVTKQVDRLNTATDHAFGTQKVRNLNLINKKLAEQASWYRKLREEADNYRKEDRKKVESGIQNFADFVNGTKYAGKYNPIQLEFDEQGLVDNEQKIYNNYAQFLNDNFVTPINEAKEKIKKEIDVAANEAIVEELEKDMEEFKEKYEELVDDPMKDLEEAINEWMEALDKEVETLYQYLQNEIDKYTIKMELHLEISDLERQLNNAIIDTMGEVGKASKQVADKIRENLQATASDVDEVIAHFHSMEEIQQRWANKDLGLKDEFHISDEAWNEALKSGMMPSEIKDAMESDIQTLFSKREDILSELDRSWQNYIDTIAYYIGEYDRLTGRLDKQAEISDNLLSIIETTGLKYKYGADETSAMYKNMNSQFDILNNKAKLVMSEMKVVSDTRKQAEEELNDILKGRSYKQFADEATEEEMYRYNKIKALYDEQLELEEDLNAQRISLMEEAYSKAADYAAQWGEQISHEFQEALGGMFDTLDEAMDMYSQKYDIDTFFMDEYDKTFELSKLQHDINKVIDDISNPEQLARYNALLEEIEAKKAEGVKITEKDLEILQAQFDLEQARDAYEDARNAKNTMRLTRDASGNYSYVYSGDSSDQEDKAMAIEEKLHNIYKLNRDAADEYSEQWLQLQVDWQNYIDSIDQARYDQDVKYRDMVNQRMAWYAKQSDLLSGEIIKHNDAIGRNFEDTTLGIITNQQSMEAANELYKQNHTELKDKLVENYQAWIDKADATRIEVGGAMESLEETVDRETEAMMEHVDDLGEKIENFTYEAESDMAQYADFVSDWSAEVRGYFQDVIDKIYETIEAYRKLLAEMENQANDADKLQNSWYDKGTDYSGLFATSYRNFLDAGGKMTPEEFLDTYFHDQIYERSSAGMDRGVDAGDAAKAYQEALAKDAAVLESLCSTWDSANANYNYKGGTSVYEAKSKEEWEGILESEKTTVKSDNVTVMGANVVGVRGAGITDDSPGAATGGLISTRQKIEVAEDGPELVLNAEDTQKILEAVQNVRALTMSQLNSNFQSYIRQASVMSEMVAQASELLSIRSVDSTPQAIEQNVHIEASFPGIDTAAEVQEALNSLIVEAAHYSITNR